MHGRGCPWSGGMCGGGMCGQGGCGQGGMHGWGVRGQRGGMHDEDTVGQCTGSMHPTGMHFCSILNLRAFF